MPPTRSDRALGGAQTTGITTLTRRREQAFIGFERMAAEYPGNTSVSSERLAKATT